MLAEVGHGAAMPSAPAEVRAVARYVAPPLEDEGAAQIIEQLVLAPSAAGACRLAPPRGGGRRAAEAVRMTARVVPDDAAGRALAVEVLRGGGIVALPTDTVYGIAVSLATPGGIERLFHVKRRPPDKAVMLLLDDTPQAARAATITPAAAALMAACWPGGLTVVVPQRPDVRWPAVLTGGSSTIGLRVPAHDAPRTLARGVGPLPTTSANVSGAPEASDARRHHGAARRRASTSCSMAARRSADPPRPSSTARATSPRSCGSARSRPNRSPRSSPPPVSTLAGA